MKTEVETLAENEVVLKVEVPEDDVRAKTARTIGRLAREVKVPGFRPGRVPRDVVVGRLGMDYILAQTLSDSLAEWYSTALDESQVDAVSQPEIDFDDFLEGQPFAFTAKVQVRPTPTLGQYRGVEAPRRTVEITDDQVDAQLTMLQERFASLTPVEGRPVQRGDFVLVDFEGFVDGKPLDGAKAQDYMFEVGGGSLIPGFSEATEGMTAGEDREVQVTFPDDYGAEDLQGREAVFSVRVKEIKEKVVPELADSFAAEVSEFDTLGELRDDLQRRLEEGMTAAAEREFRSRVLAKVVANATVNVPPAMVERQVHLLYHDLEDAVKERGIEMPAYLNAMERTKEQVEEELRPRAESDVKQALVLRAIIETEGLEASDEEVRARIQQDAELLKRDPNQFVLEVYKAGRQDLVRDELVMAKAIDLLVDNAVVLPAGADGDQEDATVAAVDDGAAPAGAAAEAPAADQAAGVLAETE